MLQSLKMLGKPMLRSYLLMSTEAASSNDPWTSLVQEIQNDPIPVRVVPKSLQQVVEEVDIALKDSTASLSTDTFFSFLQSASTDEGLTLRCKCMELLQTRVNRRKPEMCIGSITYLLKTGEKEHKLIEKFLAQIQASENVDFLNSQMVLECLSQANASGLTLPPKVLEIFTNVLLSECSAFSIAQLLQSYALVKLSGLSKLKEKLFERTKKLITEMNCSESIALLKYLCAQGLREQKIIGPAIHNITSQTDPISINQIVALAHAASFMKIYDARLLRKIAEDLNVEIIHLDWFSAVSLMDSFSRIRLDHKDLWSRLHNWVKTHIEDFRKLKMKQIALVAKSFASMNVQGSEDIAEVLLQTLQKPYALRNAPSQDAWLQAVHTLAVFDKLPSNLGETVLNENFIDALMKSSRNQHYKVVSAQRLLQVQTNLLQKYGGRYKRPRISKETFGDVLSSQDAIQSILMAKYGSSSSVCKEALFTHGLFLLAPKTHFALSSIDSRGYFWNAAISLDQNKRFTPSAMWTKETKLRPVILFDWKQRKKTLELGLGASSEESILGEERMMLRHLRTDGLDPIVVFLSDLVRFSSQDEKNAFLKSLVDTK